MTLTKFHEDRAKIADFLLIANFGMCAVFFYSDFRKYPQKGYVLVSNILKVLICNMQHLRKFDKVQNGYTLGWVR